MRRMILATGTILVLVCQAAAQSKYDMVQLRGRGISVLEERAFLHSS